MEGTIVRGADAITIHAEWGQKEVCRLFGIDKKKVTIVPLGLYEDYLVNAGAKSILREQFKIENEFVILSFGMIRKYKGIPCLIEAFDLLPAEIGRQCRLIIAGEDWNEDNMILPSIENSKYKEKIIYQPNFIPDEILPDYFSIADIVVLPYLKSCGSGVANIAMAYGKPLIISNLETMKDCCGNYLGTKFFPVGNSKILCNEIATEYAKWASGSNAFYPMPQNTWEQVAKEYEQIINNMESKK
jgi:glycosyltransferase involved in cell wall biosynthesis